MHRLFVLGITFISIFFIGLNSQAQQKCVDLLRSEPDHFWWGEARFLAPNEPYPEKATPILDQAPEGMIVGVGSERLLFDFLLKKSPTTYVVSIDLDPGIVRFHQINCVLLKMTPLRSLSVYQKLRLDPDLKEWRAVAKAAQEQGWIGPSDYKIVSNKENFRWWLQFITYNPELRFLQDSEKRYRRFHPVNYIYNADLLERLQVLSRQGRYLTRHVDLTQKESLRRLYDLLAKLNLHAETPARGISVFDISNAWEHLQPNLYLGSERVAQLLFTLQDIFARGGIFLGTAPLRVDMVPDADERLWVYTGFQMPYTSTRYPLAFWQRQSNFMDSYQRQRQKEMESFIIAEKDPLPWAELTDLLYY